MAQLLSVWLAYWLTGWLADWLTWSADWLIEWLTCWLTYRLIGWLTGSITYLQTVWQKGLIDWLRLAYWLIDLTGFLVYCNRIIMLRDGQLEKWLAVGGRGGLKSQKIKFHLVIINQIYFHGFWPKTVHPQGGSVQVRLLQINCEVNDKSRVGIKLNFFKSQHDSWVTVVKDYLDWYSCRPDTEIEEFIILHALFTNLYWPKK